MLNLNKNFLTTVLITILTIVLVIYGCKPKEPDVVKIGAVLPLTGVAAELGNYYREGITLAVEEINAKGGINGKKVLLSIEDSRTSPKEAVTVVQKLISIAPKPKIIFAHLSGVSLAIAPITDENKIPMIAVATADEIIEKYKYTSRNYVSSKRLSKYSDLYFNDSLKILSIGVLYINDNFGRSTSTEFANRTLSKRNKVIFNEAFEGAQTDFKTLTLKLKTSNPQAAYVIGYGKPLGLIIKQLREVGFKGKILSGAEVAYPDVINAAGEAIEGVVFVDLPFSSSNRDSNTQRFVSNYMKRFNRGPTIPSALAYDGIKLMLDIYSKSGEDVDEFIKNLNSVRNRSSLNGEINIFNRDIEYPFLLKIIKNKQPQNYE